MCTAISHRAGGHYFGRTLDLEYSYAEAVTVMPRRFALPFRCAGTAEKHYAVIGIATSVEGYPLFYDGMNERGLCMAALHFPGNARYLPAVPGRDNIAPFEIIPWILGQCASVRQARERLARLNVTDTAFSEKYPLTPLHWILADGEETVVLEPTSDGPAVYDDPAGVLTNNPPFPHQMDRLRDYRGLSAANPPVRFAPGMEMEAYSRGMGALGLPGDHSSPSRFVRAAFTHRNSAAGKTEEERIGQFFHIMDTVQVPRGCVCTNEGGEVITVYTSCYAPGGRCCCTTYEYRTIRCIQLPDHDMEVKELTVYPLSRKWRLSPFAPV